MSSRRTLILIAAIVLGAIAAFALFTYVGGIEDRANDQAERVEVFKIAQDIPKGTFGDEAFNQNLIVASEIPREFRPANAITDRAQIDGLVAISDLAANQVVVSEQFVSQAESLSTFSGLLKNNQVAVTVRVDDVRGVAGLLVPGDFVNILANTHAGGGEGQVADTPYKSPARAVFQKVQILAIDQDRKLEPGETVDVEATESIDGIAGQFLVTFAVPFDAAQRIASVENPDLYLTLVPRDYQPEPLPPLDTNEVLPGEEGERLTPYGPDGLSES